MEGSGDFFGRPPAYLFYTEDGAPPCKSLFFGLGAPRPDNDGFMF